MRSRKEALRILDAALLEMNNVLRQDEVVIASIAMTSNTDSKGVPTGTYTVSIATRDLNGKTNSAQGKQPYSISPIKEMTNTAELTLQSSRAKKWPLNS